MGTFNFSELLPTEKMWHNLRVLKFSSIVVKERKVFREENDEDGKEVCSPLYYQSSSQTLNTRMNERRNK